MITSFTPYRLDDDVVPKADIPFSAIKHNHHLMLLTTDHGGHWYVSITRVNILVPIWKLDGTTLNTKY